MSKRDLQRLCRLFAHSDRTQSSIEFLTTYGWAILIMAVAIAIILTLTTSRFALPANYTSGFSGLDVTSAITNGTLLEFDVVNNVGRNINITAIKGFSSTGSVSSYSCTYTQLYPGQSIVCFMSGKFSSPVALNISYSEFNGAFSQTLFSTGNLYMIVTVGPLVTFTTTFIETGLASGAKWSVLYDSIMHTTTSDKLSFTTGGGDFYFQVNASAISSGCVITTSASPSSGDLVAGSTQSESFSPATTVCTTTFTESGLPPGLRWNVTYDNIDQSSTSTSMSFSTSSGSYSFSLPSLTSSGCAYNPSPSSGTLTAGSSQSISFSSTCDTVFTESGLPSGTSWSVTYNSQTLSSTGTSISFSDAPGSYSFSVSSPSVSGCTYSPSPSSGTLTAGSSQSISYSGTCTTTFTESGLPSGTSWSVNMGWDFGTSGYNGGDYLGITNIAFPSSLNDLNNNNVPCGSPYASQGYTAVGDMNFSGSATFTIETDDAMEIFYKPVSGSTWSSVFGGSAWHGQGSTQYGPTTITISSGKYEVAVDWSNICGPGMSAIDIQGASSSSKTWNVTAWTPSSSNWDLLGYGNVTANPASPHNITIEEISTWNYTALLGTTSGTSISFVSKPGNYPFSVPPVTNSSNGCTTTKSSSPSYGTVTAGSTESLSFSSSTSCTTTFTESGLPSGTSWSVTY
ncbi:hypothetical protein M1293_02430, partial [Candidatus Parvarchaeota archaeon]|nr:hypothetical protein [Candidatus Parvarchaeota archaeon]